MPGDIRELPEDETTRREARILAVALGDIMTSIRDGVHDARVFAFRTYDELDGTKVPSSLVETMAALNDLEGFVERVRKIVGGR